MNNKQAKLFYMELSVIAAFLILSYVSLFIILPKIIISIQ